MSLFPQIREARESRDARTQQRREAMEGRLQRAEILRESHLQERIRKAQEEEAKVVKEGGRGRGERERERMEVMKWRGSLLCVNANSPR